jgi:phosphoribosylaminoimidazole-succinocarboxamide synthase
MQTARESSIEVPGVKKIRGSKVREIFDPGDTLFFVASNRISAFDVILPCAKR